MTQNNLRELARQGDPNAIATVINRSLQPKGINAQVIRDSDSLLVMLESEKQIPPQLDLMRFIHNGMTNLGVESIHTVRVFGRQTGEDEPAWEDEIELMPIDPMLDLDEGAMPKEDSMDHDLYRESEDYDEPEGDYEEEEEEEEEEEPQPQKRKIPILAIVLPLIFVPAAALAGLYFTGNLPFLTGSNSEPASSPSPNAVSPTPAAPNTAKTPSPVPPGSPSPIPVEAPSSAKASPPSPPATSPSPKPATPSATPSGAKTPLAPTKPASPASASDPWREAVSKAQTAANLTQTAQYPEDWDKIATLWQQAIALMKKVPQSNPRYAVAQKKAAEYQTNLNYAKQNAGSL